MTSIPPSRREILAASAGWVACLLNVFPGLGAGYLYQRRWKSYWIASFIATSWFVIGYFLGQSSVQDRAIQNQIVGFGGLLGLAIATSIEAGLAVKKARRN